MYIIFNVRSNVNPDSNGYYKIYLENNFDSFTNTDLAWFFDVKESDIYFLRCVSYILPNDSANSYPTIYVSDSELFFS